MTIWGSLKAEFSIMIKYFKKQKKLKELTIVNKYLDEFYSLKDIKTSRMRKVYSFRKFINAKILEK